MARAFVIRLDLPDVDAPIYMSPPDRGIPGFTPTLAGAWRFTDRHTADRWANRLVNTAEYATVEEVHHAA